MKHLQATPILGTWVIAVSQSVSPTQPVRTLKPICTEGGVDRERECGPGLQVFDMGVERKQRGCSLTVRCGFRVRV